jgi:hypothetical protein
MSKSTIEGNIVPLFKNYEELHREECEIYKDHYDKWHAAYRKWDLVKAAIDNDENELSKLAAGDSELDLAKSEAARLKKRYRDSAEFFATVELAKYLRELVERHNDRLFGMSALAKRSMRFAMAQDRRNYGPAATVTTIGIKQ